MTTASSPDNTPWRRTIRIKHILTDDDDDFAARSVGTAIVAVLRRVAANNPSFEFPNIDLFENATNAEQVNDALDALYDWGDAERVWIA